MGLFVRYPLLELASSRGIYLCNSGNLGRDPDEAAQMYRVGELRASRQRWS